MKKIIISIVVILVVVGVSVWTISEYMKSRRSARTTHCVSNLRQLDGAKEQAAYELKLDDGDTVTVEQVHAYFPKGIVLKCHEDTNHSFNTSYSIERIGSKPLCLINPASHTL